MIEWIKIDNDNLPKQGTYVLCSDGEDWEKAYVTNQFEFAENKNSKIVYTEVTHFAEIKAPNLLLCDKEEEKVHLINHNDTNSDFWIRQKPKDCLINNNPQNIDNELKWWYTMSFERRFLKTIDWLSSQNRNTTEIHPNNLTPTEIHQIYTMFYN